MKVSDRPDSHRLDPISNEKKKFLITVDICLRTFPTFVTKRWEQRFRPRNHALGSETWNVHRQYCLILTGCEWNKKFRNLNSLWKNNRWVTGSFREIWAVYWKERYYWNQWHRGVARRKNWGESWRIRGHSLKGCMIEIRQIFYILDL